MVTCEGSQISICSWSLKNSFEELNQLRDKWGVSALHLSLAPALEEDGQQFLEKVKAQRWDITSTMVGFPQESYKTLETIRQTGGIMPDDCWETNRQRVIKAIDLTVELGVKYLSFHFGFFSYNEPEKVEILKTRVRQLADIAQEKGIILLMETGQETDHDLKKFLEEMQHPAIAINLDPANMILYDNADPVEAAKTLMPWIKHVHIKDALRTETPGTWGKEVAWGSGQVDSSKFLTAIKKAGYKGAVAIEREAGETRIADISKAIEILTDFKL